MALLTLSRGDRRLVDLPTAWSNRGRHEQLQKAAAESFSNLVALAVAETGTNFQLYDALRPVEEQIALLKRNYRRVSRGRSKSSDRTWDGSTWEKRPGRPNTASPGYSNHGSGLAVDIHPGPIQEVFKAKGPAWGWSWAEGKRNGENWHYVFVGGNQYASRGWLDHAWVQKVVGADVDGKIGTGTVEKIKAWQAAHGLEADGIVGPGTKAAMLGKSVADVVEDVADKVSEITAPATLNIEEAGPAKNAYDARTYGGVSHEVKHATIHWWGRPSGQTFEGIRDYLIDNTRQVSAHYVVSGTRVARILPESRGAWGNGDRIANLEGIVIECDPNKVLETLPTLAALLADIFSRHGEIPVYPHDHWTPTECPGDYRAHIPAIVAMAKGGTVNLGRPVVTPSKPSSSKLKVDGRWGQKTTTALQERLGVTRDGRAGTQTWKALQRLLGAPYVDGEISRQSYRATELGNGIVPGPWEYTGRGSKGSQTIRLLQKRVGARADGIVYEGTTAALQRALNAGKV